MAFASFAMFVFAMFVFAFVVFAMFVFAFVVLNVADEPFVTAQSVASGVPVVLVPVEYFVDVLFRGPDKFVFAVYFSGSRMICHALRASESTTMGASRFARRLLSDLSTWTTTRMARFSTVALTIAASSSFEPSG
jgi:hypothetical protein